VISGVKVGNVVWLIVGVLARDDSVLFLSP
jgi:hypothetical protein